MGTRSASKIKLRNPAFKCDICCRRLTSAEALKTHQMCVHSVTNTVKTKAAPKQVVMKPNMEAQAIKNVKLVNPKSAPTKKVVVSNKPANKIPEKTGKVATKTIETGEEYECPKCFKSFHTYFLAHRHIQKNHSVNQNNEEVSPNSPNIIKPNVMLICIKCNRRPKSLENHKCTTYKFDDLSFTPKYICMGCNEHFQSFRLFDIHVSGLHCDGVESMFFPTNEVYLSWKDDVIKKTGVAYVLEKNSNKQMLRCPCIPPDITDDVTPYICPSCIIVRELPKGIQVHFYKNHHGHNSGKYELPDKYKKYTLSTLIQNEEAYTEIDETAETEIYHQFKQLMHAIIEDAAKIKIDPMKILLQKALDMTTVFSNEVDAESNFLSMKLVIKNDITGLLNMDQQVGKRKIVSTEKIAETVTKRFKTRTYQKDEPKVKDNAVIKIVNSYSLAQEEIMCVINEGNIDEIKVIDIQEDTTDSKLEKSPENSTDTILKETPEDFTDNKSSKVETIKLNRKHLESPSSFAESYKVFVKQLSESSPPRHKKKSNLNKQMVDIATPNDTTEIVMKEVIPKVQTTPEIKKDTLIPRPIEYKYEVQEQENDCNILILKF